MEEAELKKTKKDGGGVKLPSKTCCTVRFNVWVLWGFEAEDGPWPPVDGGLEVRLIADFMGIRSHARA